MKINSRNVIVIYLETCFYRLSFGIIARGSGCGTEAITISGAVTSLATPEMDQFWKLSVKCWLIFYLVTYRGIARHVVIVAHNSLLDKNSEPRKEKSIKCIILSHVKCHLVATTQYMRKLMLELVRSRRWDTDSE